MKWKLKVDEARACLAAASHPLSGEPRWGSRGKQPRQEQKCGTNQRELWKTAWGWMLLAHKAGLRRAGRAGQTPKATKRSVFLKRWQRTSLFKERKTRIPGKWLSTMWSTAVVHFSRMEALNSRVQVFSKPARCLFKHWGECKSRKRKLWTIPVTAKSGQFSMHQQQTRGRAR